MKNLFPFCRFPILLLVPLLLQSAPLHPQYHNADSLRQIMRAGPGSLESLHASILLAQEMMPAQMDSARILLDQAHPLETSNVIRHQAQYHNVWGLFYWFERDRQASINNYKKTLALPEDESIISLQAAAANNVGGHYMRMGQPDSARVYLMMSLDIDTKTGHETGMAKTYYDLSSLHSRLDQHELALRYITEAIRIQEADGNKERLMHSYNMLGNVFVSLSEPQKATEAYERSQAMARELGRQRTVIMMYSNLSAIWCTKEDGFDKTLTYFENGIDKARESGETDLVAILMANMGTAWLTSGEAGKALEYFDEAFGLMMNAKDQFSEMELRFRMGQAYRQLGQLGNARQYQESSLNMARRLQSPNNQSRALIEMAALDSLQGNYQGFARNYVKGVALRDSIWNNENRSRIAELQIIHDIEQKELEIEQLRQQQQVRQLRMIIVVAASGFVFVVFLLVILYLGKRQKLIRQKYVMQQQQAEAMLDANRRELTGKALSLAKSDQLITNMKNDLRTYIDNTDGDKKSDLHSVLRLLKTKDNSRQLWMDFETRFDELNEGFIKRLTGRYPSLSPAEVRLCALLRMQLSTKEIAEMIKRSTRTIENTRNSIRKKTGLQSGANLVQHLLQI